MTREERNVLYLQEFKICLFNILRHAHVIINSWVMCFGSKYGCILLSNVNMSPIDNVFEHEGQHFETIFPSLLLFNYLIESTSIFQAVITFQLCNNNKNKRNIT